MQFAMLKQGITIRLALQRTCRDCLQETQLEQGLGLYVCRTLPSDTVEVYHWSNAEDSLVSHCAAALQCRLQ